MRRQLGLLLAPMLLAACASEADQPAATPTPSAGASPVAAVPKVLCVIEGTAVEGGCPAVVRPSENGQGGLLIAITRPDGSTRGLLADAAGNIVGGDGQEADGSINWTMIIDRRGTVSVVAYGPEQYEIPDSLVRAD